MTKDEMVTLLRSVNCDENTITAMGNAFDMGFQYAKDEAYQLSLAYDDQLANVIARMEP